MTSCNPSKPSNTPSPSSPSSPSTNPYPLTPQQKAHWLQHGYIKLEACFSRQQAEEFTKDLWTRLGVKEHDQRTWGAVGERVNMTTLKFVDVREFAPRAWGAIVGLLEPELDSDFDIVGDADGEEEGGVGCVKEGNEEKGGMAEDMIQEDKKVWGDGFIVNLGREGLEEGIIQGEETNTDRGERLRGLEGWHVDGDFFVHYLDSPEQALLVIPLWSDVLPQGGGTAVATDSIKHIAHHLYTHPSGVTPWFRPLDDPSENRQWFQDLANDPQKIRADSIIEATGNVGDVYLLHPFMLHSASRNVRRMKRVITNPPVSLKAPFRYGREHLDGGGSGRDGNCEVGNGVRRGKLNLVERKTLRELGLEETGLGEWKIEGERKGWVSERMRGYEEMRALERERLEREKGESRGDS